MQTSGTAEVRRALRARLEARGLGAASDSHGLRSELYVTGEGDLARALFDFAETAAEACERMYLSGSWVEGLPPRFAVLPAAEAESPSLELLEQIRVTPVFFEVSDGSVTFPGLDALLDERLGG